MSTGILGNAAIALQRAVVAFDGGTVTYTRGSTRSVSVPAARGKSVLVTDDMTAARIEVESADYIITASLLSAFGTPAEGDRIIDVLNGRTLTCEVMTPPYQSDSVNARYRIHTKIVNVA